MRHFVTVLFLCASWVHAQPTGNVLTRVYQLRFNGSTATAFLMDYEDRQYFVTARHVMESAGEKATVELEGPDFKEWKSYPVTVLLGKNKCVDVAVLVPNEKKLSDAEPIPYPYTFAFGQEAYFLGFPYGLYTSFGQGLGVALIKHAYVSARVNCAAIYPDGDTDEYLILLDGLNNPGFSGGPVVAPDMFSPFTNIRAQKLIGVISGFQQENIPLTVGGKAVPNTTTPTDTGIIVVTYIEKAVDLIKAYVEKQKKP
ncbi:MAG: serine protease [Bryobacteraceae bacterium]